jgi:hypothetical protein
MLTASTCYAIDVDTVNILRERFVASTARHDQQWRDRYGPWAVVTGASDGIGLEIARELAARRLNLVLVARRGDVLQRLAAELERTAGVETRVIIADLAEAAAVDEVIRRTADVPVGLLVASAGFGTSGNFLTTSARDEIEMIDVNCRAVLVLSKAFAAHFATRKAGGLILFGSIVGFQGVGRAANYAATKAYVQALAEGLAIDLASLGIDVLCCAPGPVQSGFAARSNLLPATSADASMVARVTVAALGRRTTVLPGLLSKMLITGLSFLPRTARTRILSGIMAARTKHHDAKVADPAPQTPA